MASPLPSSSLLQRSAVIFFLVMISAPSGGRTDSLDTLTFGESGPAMDSDVPEEAKFESLCRCLRNGTFSHCPYLPNYGPIIYNGTCYVNSKNRSTRSSFLQHTASFSSPPIFVEDVKCVGEKGIILSSSGSEKILTLTTQASVFICPESIDVSLQQLNINSAKTVLIASNVLKGRNSSITLQFENLRSKLVIPEEAFSIDITLPALQSQDEEIEHSSTPSPPPSINLNVNGASGVEFQRRSIMAPIVNIDVSSVASVIFESEAVIPYAHPEASALEISYCVSLIMGNQAMNAGKFEAKHITHMLMKERAVEVASGYGAAAKIEHVVNMTLLDEALTVGKDADIIFNNIKISSAGVRAIRGNDLGNLRRATFTHVTGDSMASVAMCIKTETVVVFNLDIKVEDAGDFGACIEAIFPHGDAINNAVICKISSPSRLICNNPRCAPCSPTSEGDPGSLLTTNLPSQITVTSASAILNQVTNQSLVDDGMTSSPSPLGPTDLGYPTGTPSEVEITTFPEAINVSFLSSENRTEENNSSAFQNLKEISIYVIIIFLLVILIFILFITYMVYRCCTHSKHYKYCLPQENRLSTFRNPRTIMTSENLAEQSSSLKCTNAKNPKVYTAYDSYGEAFATYTVNPENRPTYFMETNPTLHAYDDSSQPPPPPYEYVRISTEQIPTEDSISSDELSRADEGFHNQGYQVSSDAGYPVAQTEYNMHHQQSQTNEQGSAPLEEDQQSTPLEVPPQNIDREREIYISQLSIPNRTLSEELII